MRQKIIFFLSLILSLICLVACNSNNVEPTPTETEAPPDINIETFILFNESGYDGYGKVEAAIQYKDLISALLPYAKSTVSSKDDLTTYLQTYVQKHNPFAIQYEDRDDYKNGDTVQINLAVTEHITEFASYFDVHFVTESTEYTIEKLKPIEDYDPFSELTLTVRGMNGEGTATATIEHKTETGTWSFQVNSNTALENLSNGDVIQLELGKGTLTEEELLRNFGLRISNKTYEHTVTELIAPPTKNNIFACIDEESISIFDSVITDWVVDGLNDENQGKYTRKAEYAGAVFMTKADQYKLFLIYHVEDGYVENGYYVYISPQKELLVNPITKELLNEDQEKVTDSFVYYDKETIRYSEKFKWGQDYERHGFMYKNVPYAGKLTLQEELTYLEETYPEFTEICYSPEINEILSPTEKE